MEKSEIWAGLGEIFAELFGADEAVKINENSQAKDVRGWDSMSHMELLSRVEEKFGIEFSYRDIASLDRVGDITDCVQKKLG